MRWKPSSDSARNRCQRATISGSPCSRRRNSAARLLPHGRVLLALLVGADVELDQVVDGPRLERGLVAPLLPGPDDEAELGAPVADVVLPDHLPALEGEDPGQVRAQVGGAQVAEVEGLGDVRRREVEHQRAPAAQVPPAEGRRVVADLAQHLLRGVGPVQEQVEVGALRPGARDDRVGADLRRQVPSRSGSGPSAAPSPAGSRERRRRRGRHSAGR